MMLNRHVCHAELPHDGITRKIHEAVSHAERLLSLMEELWRVIRHSRATLTATQHSHHPKNKNWESIFSTPFPGHAILMAIEILGAASSTEASFPKVLRIMNNGLDIFRGLSILWASARDQTKAIVGRIEDLANAVLDNGPYMRAWVVSVPMEKIAGADQDVFTWARPDLERREGQVLLEALGVEAREDEILYIGEGESRRSSVENSPVVDDWI
ncbi:MAG: hypothetical protein Q9187_008417 [Circinaria calcarea]